MDQQFDNLSLRTVEINVSEIDNALEASARHAADLSAHYEDMDFDETMRQLTEFQHEHDLLVDGRDIYIPFRPEYEELADRVCQQIALGSWTDDQVKLAAANFLVQFRQYYLDIEAEIND